MNLIAAIVTALMVWALLSWLCGLAIGCVIDLMAGEDEHQERRWQLSP